MAEIVTPDKSVALRQKQAREMKEVEEKEKAAYLDSLKASRKFQKYVVKPALDYREQLLDLSNIPNGNYEEMGKLVNQNKLAAKAIDTFLKPFLD